MRVAPPEPGTQPLRARWFEGRRARTALSHYATNPRWVYYLSAEYLMGRQLEQNLLYSGTETVATWFNGMCAP